MYIYTYIHTYIYTHTYINIYVCMDIYICVYIYIYMCITSISCHHRGTCRVAQHPQQWCAVMKHAATHCNTLQHSTRNNVVSAERKRVRALSTHFFFFFLSLARMVRQPDPRSSADKTWVYVYVRFIEPNLTAL